MNPIFSAAFEIQEDLIWRELPPLLQLKESPGSASRLRAALERARG